MKITKKCLILFITLLFGCNNYAKNNNYELLTEPKIIELGHKYAHWFYSNQFDSLINCIFDKNYKLSDLRDFREKVKQQLGEEKDCINEQIHISMPKDRYIYTFIRCSNFSKVNKPIKTTFGFDRLNNIYIFSVQSLPGEAPTKYSDYKTKTKLRLPFDGEWYVGAGGRNIVSNHHVVSGDQRFAYDFIIKRNNLSFQNKGKKNEDYYC